MIGSCGCQDHPTGFPENVRKVDSYGFELSGSIGFQIGFNGHQYFGKLCIGPDQLSGSPLNESDVGIGHQFAVYTYFIWLV